MSDMDIFLYVFTIPLFVIVAIWWIIQGAFERRRSQRLDKQLAEAIDMANTPARRKK